MGAALALGHMGLVLPARADARGNCEVP